MTLEAWSESGLITPCQATQQEISDLLAVANTDLRDAAIAGLSPERKLGCAYGAILSAARTALHAAGYRVSKSNRSHHHYIIQSLRYTVESPPSVLLRIEALQKKRNTADYVRVGEVSDDLAADARALAGEVLETVRQWLAENHSNLLSA